ncbi:MAG: uracil-xanthine permease family protein [Bacteroidales bacterium]
MNQEQTELNLTKKIIIGIQMLFVAFGATVLVPLLVGIDPAVALFTAGCGTLLFHFITKGKVPVFLGSSFVFIAPIIKATELYGFSGALGGLMATGFVYVLFSFIVKKKGMEFLSNLFPPVVIGPVIMIIGMSLAETGVSMASQNWLLAGISLITAILVVIFGKGTFKLLPVISGIVISYIVAVLLKLVDFTKIIDAPWFYVPQFSLPTFNIYAILFMIPVAIAPMIEHIGDMYAISKATNNNFIKNPGISRTMFGDGCATILSSLFGGPPNTTYSEVTGAIILTKLKDPVILRIAAITAIVFAFLGKITGFLNTIPQAILGGTMLLLFGMITIVGLKTIMEARVNLNHTKNMVIIAVMLTIGVGGAIISYGNFAIGGIALSSVVGIILNQVLPNKEKDLRSI